MAKILCAYSGLQFSVEHFPISLTERECVHPVFCTTHRRLFTYAGRWSNGELSFEESYLLFLGLLNSTDLVEFRSPVVRTPETPAILANNMQALLRVTGYIDTLQYPELALPRFVISPDSNDLSNVDQWIEAWFGALKELADGYRNVSLEQKLLKMEKVLERLIKTPMRTPESYANTLATWAEVAGRFPHGTIPMPGTNENVPLAEYWKTIIRKCANKESIFHIPAIDLDDLIEHCEENIPAGTVQAHSLMTLLRNGRSNQRNYLGIGDNFVSATGGFQILDASSSVEDANKIAIIAVAPKEAPTPEQYATKFAYIKAKLAYDLAQSNTLSEAATPAPASFTTSTGTGTSSVKSSNSLDL